MPVTLTPGRIVKGYTIVRKLNQGAMALSYEAKAPDGKRVFFKSYKLPAVMDPWYRGYISYQDELKRRIQTSRAIHYTYEFIDFFEEKVGCPTYFQVFGWVEASQDLAGWLAENSKHPAALNWDHRLILARTLMACMEALHEIQIVHCDLKPANICLVKDSIAAVGYVLKIVDMDYSILADRKAPWDKIEGYVGTARYLSPEHLAGKIPIAASDVFTCGLILYELLAQGHPYPLDDDEYKKAVLAYGAAQPVLAGTMPVWASNAMVQESLYRCLDPRPENRPSAREVLMALQGKLKPAVGAIELVSEVGRTLMANLKVNRIGRHLLESWGEQAGAFDIDQMVLVKVDGEGWYVEPNVKAVNETLLNGKAIRARAPLRTGDVLAVGSEARGVIRHPLRIRIT